MKIAHLSAEHNLLNPTETLTGAIDQIDSEAKDEEAKSKAQVRTLRDFLRRWRGQGVSLGQSVDLLPSGV